MKTVKYFILANISSMIIEAGRQFQFITFLFMCAIVLYYLWTSMQGKRYPVRSLPAVEAISDGVDRAVETGTPVYATPGGKATFTGMYAPMTIAGLNVMRYTIKMAVTRGARVILPSPPYVGALPLMQGIFHEECIKANKPEAYKVDDVLFFGSAGYGPTLFAIGMKGVIAREGAGLVVDVGATTSDADLPMNMYARELGAIIISGTCRYHHQGTKAISADYPLFLDDVYAAGAYCSEDPVVLSSIVGGDIIKMAVVVVTILSIVLEAGGLNVLPWFKM